MVLDSVGANAWAASHEPFRRTFPRAMRRLASSSMLKRATSEGKEGRMPLRSRPDFTGVWKQVHHENADAYFQAMGYPFATRRIMLLAIGQSTEVLYHEGESIHTNSINKRGEWQRTYLENEENVPMKLADGQSVKTRSWWEKDEGLGVDVHKTRLVGAKQGVLETWRWVHDGDGDGEGDDGKENVDPRGGKPPPRKPGKMVVKSIVYPEGRDEESMLWHFEPVDDQGGAAPHLLKRFEESYVRGFQQEGGAGASSQDPRKDPMRGGHSNERTSWLERFSRSLEKSFVVTAPSLTFWN
ncbi:hypothetical protein HOP50_09g55230 [Chloropicon primus]|uniref:Uncharacterized protein n=1 Tax=Chloropicon primus TaxID=1764295 RepID=A0A5B8MU64_9CHLO|nr:hypothetical protein A3770_09p54980 [Chloropicon primus]UPR02197.1 hypothetical protein HOP50_09g55230 [Chloropicon primus]|eukprot:QDZ22980.1 hypothetical protein A3770_09p54980 [Chloropicon primus]